VQDQVFCRGHGTFGPATPVLAEPVRTPITTRLPTQLLDQASSRLVLFGSVIAGAISFFIVMEHAAAWVSGRSLSPGFDRARWVELGLVGLSILMAALARSRRLRPETLLNVALVYEVVGGALSAWEHWYLGALVTGVMSITWLCVWIVMFPLIVPLPPGRSAVAAFATASTPLLVLGVAVALGDPLPPPRSLQYALLPNYLAAMMSIVPSTLLYRLQTSLGRAQQEVRDLGSYKLVKRLGLGGMGEVWQAEHRMLSRPAAIKLIQADLVRAEDSRARDQALARFEQEARVTSLLHSPHTVGLYDFGVTQDGTFYYVMELLTGLDLQSLVAKFGPISPARTIYLLTQTCRSLAEAHHAGLVHRDIKPANIYLCRVGLEHDFVKVLDFGLVKRTGRGKPADAGLTDANSIVGTPTFMPPEMAEGRADVDARADIYALGCVGYWLLTGTPVFGAEGRGAVQILMDHIGTLPDRPSRRLGKEIPDALEKLLMECLEKDPKKRPQSAVELGERLGSIRLDESWTEVEARRWWSDHLKEDAVPKVSPESPTTITRQPSFGVGG
jgi:serine/threonine-protein kinase